MMAMAAATSTTCSGGAVAGVGGRGSAAARRQAPRRAAPRAVASTSSSVQLARPLGLTLASGPGDNGVWVEDIVAGSNAEASGAFAAGDVVTAVDGWQCAGEPFEDVLAVLAAGGEGDSVELELNRAGEGALTGVAGRIALAANAQREGVTVTASGLQYEVLSEGKGRKVASVNDSCVVHYEGKLTNGQKFDSSYDRGKPAEFKPKQVIAGWTEALLGMREGDTWQVLVPCELGYGKRGSGALIKAGDALSFKIELQRVF